jgi:hypothetical protein
MQTIKNTKYQDISAEFIPLVIESFGGYGQEFGVFLEDLHNIARYHLRLTYHLDISNTDAHTTSYRSYALAKPGGAIIQQDNGKIYKYKGATDLLRYGGMGEHSTKFICLFARSCRDNCLIDT